MSIQPSTPPYRRYLRRPKLETMFEEDYERCFICSQPCKGLYCSSECRLQDKGTASPAAAATPPGPRVTAHVPPALSPLLKPTNHHSIGPSPLMPASNADSSSSSSITSSPLQSPQTNPSDADSPRREAFDLPPPAYGIPSSLGFTSSMPIKMPPLVSKASPSLVPASDGSTVLPMGASIDTLRFGRKPGLINAVTSPNAMGPRCACGKAANHRDRRTMSKDRGGLESGIIPISLGPPVVHSSRRTHRIASDPSVVGPGQSVSGYTTPDPNMFSTSYLSRSRSDPLPPSPKKQGRPIPIEGPEPNRDPASRRGSHAGLYDLNNIPNSITRSFEAPMRMVKPPAQPASPPRRGRSRDRAVHPLNNEITGPLNHPPDREAAPSRSRNRRDAARRQSEQADRDRADRDRPSWLVLPTPIAPVWSHSKEAQQPASANAL